LVDLPLILHVPSLHTAVVHGGLLPADLTKSISDPSQPLMIASGSTSTAGVESRAAEELSILLDIPQNTIPWNLINMRSVYEEGSNKGEVTQKGKKGTPWSWVWAREMARCRGLGAWMVDNEQEGADEDEGLEELEDGEDGDGEENRERDLRRREGDNGDG
jgi:hypothetical protein